jgi:K+-sensing histidine kinase KdpD
MHVVKETVTVAVSLAVIAAVTAVLWYTKAAGIGPHHPIFFYLLPIAVVAILCGALPAALCAAAALLCSSYFLYDPAYSFQIANGLEWGDFICFALLAGIGIKCSVDLARPVAASKSRYGRT